MKRFAAIEGLRAWLAWAVVFWHCIFMFGIHRLKPELFKLYYIGDFAVGIFIIISGFVITHLLLERKEPYRIYITRRFLRIYPAYLVCLLFGIAATHLMFSVMLQKPWGELTPSVHSLSVQLASLETPHGYLTHLLAHLTMLHGAIPSSILQYSQYMFLPPAWSLSLEWQFYLIAPLVVWACASQIGQVLVAFAALASFIAYQLGFFGDFAAPSFIPGAAPLFATGIITRLIWNRLARLNAYPAGIILCLLMLLLFSIQLLPYILWLSFVLYLLLDDPKDAVSRAIKRCGDLAFNSRLAHYLGERSYTTYLIHTPVIQVCMYVALTRFNMGFWQTAALSAVVTPVVTALLSALIYKTIEKPAINLGKRIK